MDLRTEIYSPKWEVFPANWKTILSQNIRSERARLGISQKELATKMGASDGGTISYWENAKGFFNMETLVLLGEYFGRNPNELLTIDLSGSSPPPQKAPLSIERDDGAGADGGGGHDGPAAAESPPAALETAEGRKAARLRAYRFLEDLEKMEESPPPKSLELTHN